MVAANLRLARLPRRTNVPSSRIERIRVQDDGENPASVGWANHQNRALHARAWIAEHDTVTIVDLPDFLRRHGVGGKLVDRRLREQQDSDAHSATVLLPVSLEDYRFDSRSDGWGLAGRLASAWLDSDTPVIITPHVFSNTSARIYP